jgi:protein-serine/threonine kinase
MNSGNKSGQSENSSKNATSTGTKRASSPGCPNVQDVDGFENPNYNSSYGQEHFLPLKKLGSGSFGDVFLVRDKNSGKLYAMKTLSKRKILG